MASPTRNGHSPNVSISGIPRPQVSPTRSRPSSRSSIRSGRASPAVSLDDPVAVRGHISSLKHNIRHQQAQVNELENSYLRGPRPNSDAPPDSPNSMAAVAVALPSPTKVGRRSSFEVLAGIAGPESSLPLPRRVEDDGGGIREGIPTSFGSMNNPHSRRNSSPTRTLSRIPVSSVGNARALADEGQPPPSTPRNGSKLSVILDGDASPSFSGSFLPPPSPNRRASLTPGGTTKVLADLQAGVINARNALENTKAQLRLSQRSVAQLTRQTEDLKESRERLRLENEGLNNVVARKERLLQEVLERARKAEAEAAQLKSELKSETSTSKKKMREMESALTESTALSTKCEREYITLRDSIKGLVEGFKRDIDTLKADMKKKEDKLKSESESMATKYRNLLDNIKGVESLKTDITQLRKDDKEKATALEAKWTEDIDSLREQIAACGKQGEGDSEVAQTLATELARLRRLMRAAGRSSPPTP
ncbi:hypothetical protein CYLTODRAFT_433070 [Cylindrobasidium torrendii FP15055 ss-10]|uniref:SWI5-dependent HO expression protein 3 n=1 Tax=Cylindrobasidium torrendii FP15055 ss-10 TaxID=1314674 RepID=A0A0D7AZ30_9AGAR|nr:hypothetical protein CYLTODRAFT_433070 [Cylindrobasidium torrendii FP15055 ss-10]